MDHRAELLRARPSNLPDIAGARNRENRFKKDLRLSK